MPRIITILLITVVMFSVSGLGITHQSSKESHQLKHLDSRSKSMAKDIKAMKKSTEANTRRSKKIRASTKATDQKFNTLVACPSNAPTRFVDNGNGTICDRQTGLMWEMKDASDNNPDHDNPRDVDNSYRWTSTLTTPDGPAFTDFLARLNGAVASSKPSEQLGGYSDWRLPTSAELQTIVDCSFGIPCIDPIFGPTAARFYWSSTSGAAGRPDIAWDVNYKFGSVSNDSKQNGKSVRAVRGGR